MKTRSSYPAKAKQHDDPIKQLKQLSGKMNPGQVFKKYFVERLTPDPVEMEIAPPAQLFSRIIEGKVKITFEVGLLLGRYFGSCVQGLVDYQDRCDRRMDRKREAIRSAEFKAGKRERALVRRQVKQWAAKILRELRAKRRSKQ